MAKTTFLATDPNGVVHKRTTESRKYTHTVVGLRSKDWAIATARGMRSNSASNFKHYSEFLDGTSRFLLRRSWQTEQQHQEQMDADIQRARDALQGDMMVEDYITRKECEYLEDIEKADRVGEFSKYHNLGWCGRLSLAQSLAGKNPHSYWAKTVILEAVKKV